MAAGARIPNLWDGYAGFAESESLPLAQTHTSAFCLLFSRWHGELGYIYAIGRAHAESMTKVPVPQGWQLDMALCCSNDHHLVRETERLAQKILQVKGSSRVQSWNDEVRPALQLLPPGREDEGIAGSFAYVLLNQATRHAYVGSTKRLRYRMQEHAAQRPAHTPIYCRRQRTEQAARYAEELLLLSLSHRLKEYTVEGGSDAIQPRNSRERVRAVHGLCCICGLGSHNMNACEAAAQRAQGAPVHERLYTTSGFATSLNFEQMAMALDACVDALRCAVTREFRHPSQAALATTLLSKHAHAAFTNKSLKALRDMCVACGRLTEPHAEPLPTQYGIAGWDMSEMVTATTACVDALQKRIDGCAHYGQKHDLVTFLLRDDHVLPQFCTPGPLRSLLDSAAARPREMRPQDSRPDGYRASKRYRAG